jgi:predicted amidohydrolase YtcJ
MKKLGISPSFFSAHTYYWGDRHREIFMGPERAARMSPAKSAIDAELKFSIHLDTPVVPMQPMLLVWSAVNRFSSSGEIIGEEQRIPPMAALRAVTIDAAWQIRQEDNRGSLEAGKWADLIILSDSPLRNYPGIKDIKVLETVIAGKTVFER